MLGLMNPSPKTAKRFNPEAFKTDVMRLPPHEAADVTLKWRERAMNAAEDMATATHTVGRIGAGGLAVFLIGMMDGSAKAKRDKMIKDWEAGGAEEAETDLETHETPWAADHASDPTKFFGFIPKTLGVVALIAVAGIFDWKGAPFIRTMALAGTFFFVGGLGENLGHKLRTKKLENAGDEEDEED